MLQSPDPKRIQLLSTENTCKSPMCLADARARSSAVLRDSSFKSTDVTGSNGGCERALNTTSRPQAGSAGGRGECNPFAPLRKITTSACLQIDCPPCGERNEAMLLHTLSVLMVEIHYPACTVENSEHPTGCK